jgi:hypothetical protein
LHKAPHHGIVGGRAGSAHETAHRLLAALHQTPCQRAAAGKYLECGSCLAAAEINFLDGCPLVGRLNPTTRQVD